MVSRKEGFSRRERLEKTLHRESLRLLPKQVLLHRPGNYLEARTKIQLLKDFVDVGRHRTLGDHQLFGYPAVGQLLGDQHSYLSFATREGDRSL